MPLDVTTFIANPYVQALGHVGEALYQAISPPPGRTSSGPLR